MNNSAGEHPALRERFAEAFSRLPEQDIEQFYAQYQLWLLRRRVPIIQRQLEALDEHLAENRQAIQSLQPSAIALAVLARLQANGVSNIELLDQMLERGEDWLDRMMQRLDYCEQVQDFIQGDYTQWCYRSLEGAYDWIDTLLGSVKEGEEPRPPVEEDTEATEELLLQRLRVDDEEEMLESTLKQPAVPDEGESGAAESSGEEEIPLSVAEQFLMAGSTVEEQGEEGAGAEQSPELASWKDLEAPEERPDPWYSVNLAADASEATQPEEMNEWIKVLEVENVAKGGMNGAEDSVDSASVQTESEVSTEQAESGEQILQAEPAEVVQASENSLRVEGADVAEEDAPVIEDASSATEPAIAPEEIPDGQPPDGAEEAGEDLPAENEMVEGEAVAASISSQEDHEGGEAIHPADEDEATSALVESSSTVDEAPRNMEEEASVEEAADFPSDGETAAESAELHAVESEEIVQNEPGEGQEIGAGQELEIGKPGEEAEAVIGGEEANEATGRDELSGEPETTSVQSEIASEDPQEEASASAEEERPWYEYLDLKEPVAQEQSRVEARVEPGRLDPVEVAGSAANSELYETVGKSAPEESQPESAIQEAVERQPEGGVGERTASEVPEDDATQPMALRDIQRADLSETAHAESGESEGMHLAASEIASSKVGEVAVSAESGQGMRGPDEVRETISFATREAAGLPEAMKEQALHESSTQEKRESVSQPARQSLPQPQPEGSPGRRGFWQRLFALLRGK